MRLWELFGDVLPADFDALEVASEDLDTPLPVATPMSFQEARDIFLANFVRNRS